MPSPKDLLFGRLAMSMGFVTREQLDECVQYQKERAPNCPLGLVLVDKGYLKSEDLQELVSAQQDAFKLVDPQRKRRVEDVLFGQVATKEGLVPQEAVNQALRDQAIEEEAGTGRPLGGILVERGLLSPEQVEYVLALQRRRFVVCPTCGAQFSTEMLEAGKRFRCGKCKTVLEAPRSEPPPLPPPVPFAAGGIREDSGGLAAMDDLEAMDDSVMPSLGASTIPDELERSQDEKATKPVPQAMETSSEGSGGAETDPLAADVPFPMDDLESEDLSAGVDDIENRNTIAVPRVRLGLTSDPDLEKEEAALENMRTMAFPAVGGGSSRPESPSEDAVDEAEIESMRTMAVPGLGRAAAAAPPTEEDLDVGEADIASMRTMATPGIGRAAAAAPPTEEDLDVGEADIASMRTMATPGIGRTTVEGIESMRTMATPGVGKSAPAPARAAPARGLDPNALVTFDCSCGRAVSAPVKMAGKTGKCPACGKRILIPQQLAGQLAGAPAAVAPAPAQAARPAPASPAPAQRKARKEEAEPPVAGKPWEVAFIAGSLSGARDSGFRGPGTFALTETGLEFAGGGKTVGILTFLGVPLGLAAGGAALALEVLPQLQAVAAGAAAALVFFVLDLLIHRRKPEPISVDHAAVREYKSEPKPKIVFALDTPSRGTVCVSLVPKPADRKRLLQILSERF